MADLDDLDLLYATINTAATRLDIVVANAGGGRPTPFGAYSASKAAIGQVRSRVGDTARRPTKYASTP
jgi:hypothetical protein